MPEYVPVRLRYPIAASVKEITAAIDDLKAKHQDGFTTFVKTGPTTYCRSEIEATTVYDLVDDTPFEVSLSNVINFVVVPANVPSSTRRTRASRTKSVLCVFAEMWIGACPTGPSTIEVGEVNVEIHQKVDPLVTQIIERVNLHKVTRKLDLG